MTSLTKDMFKQFLRNTINEHPEWAEDAVMTVTRAVASKTNAKLQDALEKRARAEAALCIAETHIKKNIPAQQLWVIEEAIIQSGLTGGSPYALELEEKHARILAENKQAEE